VLCQVLVSRITGQVPSQYSTCPVSALIGHYATPTEPNISSEIYFICIICFFSLDGGTRPFMRRYITTFP
jgi:hypothetical protein